MRWLALLLILLGCTACQHQHPRDHGATPALVPSKAQDAVGLGHMSTFEGANYFFETTQGVIDAAPKWKANEAFPPLSPRKAMVAALREVKRLRPDVAEWNLERVALEGRDSAFWFYEVTFTRSDVPYTGLPYFLHVPVLMDGTAVRGVMNLH